MRMVHDYKTDVTVFFENIAALRDEQRRSTIEQQRSEYERILVDALKAAMDDGRLRPINARMCSFFLLGSINFMHVWYRPDGELGIEALSDLFMSMWLDGLARR
jgi:TetR/AcrR family transcriptional regulator, cholesterol catabolism regulator